MNNTMSAIKFEQTEKEQIEHLRFPAAEVLTDPSKIKEREISLQRALILGNRERGKSKIYFQTDEGFKVVETTVWGVTDKRIILKQGVVIPIHRVHEIKN